LFLVDKHKISRNTLGNKMKKYILPLIAIALAALPATSMAVGIKGTVHDLSHATWNTRHGLCSPCHTIHHTDPAQLIPLWTHATTANANNFTPYSSPSLNATVGQPSGVSLACLSCHDGTVAINQNFDGSYTNGSSAGPIASGAIIPDGASGNDIHTTHPISFTYDTALATADGFLNDPASTLVVQGVGKDTTGLAGKTIAQALLKGGQMECSSCHDVHAEKGAARTGTGILTIISGDDSGAVGSMLCRNCHLK
jgi:hypothetical protein